jgi:hypothetical protein
MSANQHRFAIPAYLSVSAFAVILVVTTAVLGGA